MSRGAMMGKMLESLKRIDARDCSGLRQQAKPAEPAEPAEKTVQEPHYVASFIEVGAPDRRIEASPDVLAAPVPQSRKVDGSELPQGDAGCTQTPDRKPDQTTIVYEPWTVSSQPAKIPAQVVTHHKPDDPLAREYRELVTKLRGEAEGSLCLLFCAVDASKNISPIVLNLAFAAAAQGNDRTVIVEGNFAKPNLASDFGLSDCAGFEAIADGQISVERAIYRTAEPLVQILPAQVSQRVSAEVGDWVLRWLREKFDLVLVAGPTIGSDQSSLISCCDAVCLVASLKTPVCVTSIAQDVEIRGGRVRGIIRV